MNNLVPFKFENHSIRVIIIDGEPMFSARDVALALGYRNPARAYQDHCKWLKKLSYNESLELGWINPNPQGEYVMPESDVYRLVAKSQLASSQRFETWVYDEVIPSIRNMTSQSVAMVQSTDLVTIQNGSPVTTTLAIAEGTEVQHKSVLELVRKYLGDLRVFGPVAFETRKGEALPQGGFARATEYAVLNERQATLIISWMRNSEIVRAFKLRLVSKFYEMAEELKGKQQPLLPEELLVQQAQMLLEQKKEMLRIEAKQRELEIEVKQTNQRLDQIETGIDHFTIIGYARTFLKKSLPLKDAAIFGKVATRLCNDMGIAMGTVPDPRFGQVNTYPKSVLDEVCH